MMMRASNDLPDEMWAVAAVQNWPASAKIEPLLTEVDKAILIGVGGWIAHVGKEEMAAEIRPRSQSAKRGS
jgi:hypothetical protein